MRIGSHGGVVMSMWRMVTGWCMVGYGYVTGTPTCGRGRMPTIPCSVTLSALSYNGAYTLMNGAHLETEAQSRMLEYVTLHNLWWFTIIGRVWRNGVSAYMAQSGDYGHDAAICVHD